MLKIKLIAQKFEAPIPINEPTGRVGNASVSQSLTDLMRDVVGAIFTVGGIAFFIYTLYGGIRYLTAAGDEKALKEAQKILTNGIIGLSIIAASAIIAKIIGTVLGINILSPSFE